ncbi:hypothetical protein [Variovorax paradoxus]|uniref:hypothetical protein n=1 Tax=Variovorax paradoxus TaxID=34073 RepID=UPI003D6606B9
MAELKVNAAQWNAISEDERKQITDIINKDGTEKCTIVGDAAAPEFEMAKIDKSKLDPAEIMTVGFPGNLIPKDINPCYLKCNALAAAEAAGCVTLSGPGLVACMAAVAVHNNDCNAGC